MIEYKMFLNKNSMNRFLRRRIHLYNSRPKSAGGIMLIELLIRGPNERPPSWTHVCTSDAESRCGKSTGGIHTVDSRHPLPSQLAVGMGKSNGNQCFRDVCWVSRLRSIAARFSSTFTIEQLNLSYRVEIELQSSNLRVTDPRFLQFKPKKNQMPKNRILMK